MKQQANKQQPTVAPGMDDFLEQDASPKEIKRGEYTKVTRLSYDETH
ncbi:hypothetical protein [Desulforamulus ferrireducens]|nr:hypothetical protein [Desulforamulus ferrireducens]